MLLLKHCNYLNILSIPALCVSVKALWTNLGKLFCFVCTKDPPGIIGLKGHSFYEREIHRYREFSWLLISSFIAASFCVY